ncbi:MAG TPA: M1 family aminopeptidase [Spirochaetia bacterium]|nr:M1 family aminopeptidase [Spirochaetia bacterium]
MNKAATAVLLFIVSGCALLGPHNYTSIDKIAWQDFTPFVGVDRDERILSEYPFLQNAPAYRLTLNISEDLARITASEAVRYTNSTDRPIEAIDFLLLPNISGKSMAVTHLSADGVDLPVALIDDGLLLRLNFAHPLPRGKSSTITIGYTIEVPQSTAVGFGGLELANGTLTLGYAYPMIPSTGRWDSGRPPAYGDLTANPASFYLLQVSYPTGLELVSPGRLLHRSTHLGTQTALIAMGPSRDIFLQLAPAAELIGRTSGGVELRAEQPAGSAASAKAILDAASYAIGLYSSLFGPYPYRELTFVGARFDAYGLEFPGIILLTSRLFGDPNARVDGTPRRVLLEATVAHEVAHQWFYGLIGTNQLVEPWIDEGFAQYATYRYYLARYGAAGAQGFLRSLDARIVHGGNPELLIGGAVDSYTPREYSAAIYARAPLFLIALSERLGPELFDSFLLHLNATYRWRTMSGSEVKAAAEESCGCRLDNLWQKWVEPGPGGGHSTTAAGVSTRKE